MVVGGRSTPDGSAKAFILLRRLRRIGGEYAGVLGPALPLRSERGDRGSLGCGRAMASWGLLCLCAVSAWIVIAVANPCSHRAAAGVAGNVKDDGRWGVRRDSR
jgi:hypothetical protein